MLYAAFIPRDWLWVQIRGGGEGSDCNTWNDTHGADELPMAVMTARLEMLWWRIAEPQSAGRRAGVFCCCQFDRIVLRAKTNIGRRETGRELVRRTEFEALGGREARGANSFELLLRLLTLRPRTLCL